MILRLHDRSILFPAYGLLLLGAAISLSRQLPNVAAEAVKEAGTKAGILIAARGSAVDDLMGLVIPSTVQITSSDPANPDNTTLTLVSLKYLDGSNSAGEARLLGLLYPGPAPMILPASPFIVSDNDSSLEAIGKRALSDTGAPQWLAVVALSARWADGRMVFSVHDGKASVATRNESTSRAPSYVIDRLHDKERPVRVVDLDTSSIHLRLDPDHELILRADGRFRSGTAYVRLVPDDSRESGIIDTELDFSQASPNANIAAEMSTQFVNHVFGSTFVKPVKLKKPGTPLSVRDLGFAVGAEGSTANLSATVADTPGGSRFRLTSKWAGDDLALKEVTLSESECGQLSALACLREKTKYAVAAKALSTVFLNTPFRPNSVQRIRIQLGGGVVREMLLGFSRAQAYAGGVRFYGNWWPASSS
jgi:hypothetical protein